MPIKPRNYLHKTANIDVGKDLHSVGNRAILVRELHDNKISLPASIVLSSDSFDDFLEANDLIEDFFEILKLIDPDNERSIEKAANKLTGKIYTAKIPKIIIKDIEKAFNGLTANKHNLVSLYPSTQNPILAESLNQTVSDIEYLSSLEDVVAGVKLIWENFFSKSAIEYRSKAGYKGYLGVSILFQQILPAEVSGKIYSVGINGNPELSEIEAIYGSQTSETIENIVPDKYWFDKKTETVVRSYNYPQPWMIVFDQLEEHNLSKQPISRKIQKTPKINEIIINKLVRMTQKVANQLENHIRLDWMTYSGKIIITDVKILTERDLLDARELERYRQNLVKEGMSKKGGHNKNKPEKSKYIEKSLLKKIQPVEISHLTRIISALGNKKGAVYGLISSEISTDKSISEKILITKTISESEIGKFNKYQGLIISSKISKSLLQEIKVPCVYSAKVASDLLQEGEIITIDSDIGYIYLGAGEKSQEESIITSESEEGNDFEESAVDSFEDSIDSNDEVDNLDEVEVDLDKNLNNEDTEKEKSNEEFVAEYNVSKTVKNNLQDNSQETQNNYLEESKEIQSTPTEIKTVLTSKSTQQEEPKVSSGTGLFYNSANQVIQHNKSTRTVNKKARLSEQLAVNAKEEKFNQRNASPDKEKPSKLQTNSKKSDSKIPFVKGDPDSKQKEHKPHILVKTKADFFQIFNPADPIIDYLNISGLEMDFDDFYNLLEIDPNDLITNKDLRKDFAVHMYNYLKETLSEVKDKNVIIRVSNGEKLFQQELPDQVSGAASIIDENKIFLQEIAIIKKIRNKAGYKNVWLTIPGVRTPKELSTIKKYVTGKGLRRSSTFKIIAEIDSPLGALSIGDILEIGIDGIAINLDKMLYQLYHKKDHIFTEVSRNFVSRLIERINGNKAYSYLRNQSIVTTEKELKEFIKSGLDSYIYSYYELADTKVIVAKNESKKLKTRKKRGPKPKDIHYGF